MSAQYAGTSSRESVEDLGVEDLSTLLLEYLGGAFQRQRRAIGAVADQGVEAIDHGQDAGQTGNRLAFELLRVSLTVPVLVVATDDLADRFGKPRRLDNRRPDRGVRGNLAELVLGQPGRVSLECSPARQPLPMS